MFDISHSEWKWKNVYLFKLNVYLFNSNLILFQLLHMALFLPSPKRLLWFNYMQYLSYIQCDCWKYLRFCFFSLFSMWCFFYFGHLILFPVLWPVDVMVICDLVEKQIMDSRGMAKCSQFNLMKFFTSIIAFWNAVADFHFHPTNLSSRGCSSFVFGSL